MARKGGVSKTKAFRKTDISAVESNLEDARVQKQVAGVVIAEASDSALFTVDKKGDLAKAGWTRPVKPLMLDEIVRPKSKIDVPAQKKASKVDDALVKKRLQASLKNTKLGKDVGTPKQQQKKAIVDPWADDVLVMKSKATPKPVVQKIKAVRPPPSGASYNPEATSHEALMEAAAAQEISRLERVEKPKNALLVPQASRPDTVNYDETTGMIFDDIFASEDEHAEVEETPGEGQSTLDSTGPIQKRKSKAEKKRDAEAAKAELAKREQKLTAIVDNQALHSRTLLKKIKEERRAEANRKRQRSKAAAQKSMVGRKLGPNRFVPQMMEVQLPEELSSSLRSLRPEGNLLEDRFKALQEQAKIEPRVRRTLKKRKYELKTYEKHTYKNFA
jgi:nucleolar protein 53